MSVDARKVSEIRFCSFPERHQKRTGRLGTITFKLLDLSIVCVIWKSHSNHLYVTWPVVMLNGKWVNRVIIDPCKRKMIDNRLLRAYCAA